MPDKKQVKSLDNFNSTAELTENPGFQSTISISSKDVVDEGRYEPFQNRNLEHPNSTLGSILHLLKACLGSGILAMPAAFKNAGLIAGSIGTIIAGVVCTHAVHMLVKTSQDVCVDARRPLLGYADTCGAAFTHGPKRLRPYGDTIKTIVDYSMTLTYISILCVYVVFIGSTMKEILDEYTVGQELSIQTYCALTLVPLVLICQIRNLKYLVPFSLVANVLIVVVFSITMYYIFTDLPSVTESDRDMVAGVTQWPLFLSTVIFAMEGVGVVMPVENEMKHPQKFLGCPGVLNTSMAIVITLYGVVGFFGYLKYGDTVKGSVTLNLPQDYIVAQCAQALMAVVVFLTYALQFYVPMEVVSRRMAGSTPAAPSLDPATPAAAAAPAATTPRYYNVKQVALRTTIVTVTVAIAAAFPDLEMVISLVGAVFLSTLGLLIPAVVNTVYLWDRDLGPCYYILWKNILIGIVSIIALVSGSYVSILGLIENSSRSNLEVSSNVTAREYS